MSGSDPAGETTDAAFDRALVAAVLAQAAGRGWPRASVVEAAREAGLPLERVRARAPSPAAILLRFGAIADGDALRDMPQAGAGAATTLRDRLFDLLMRRFDTLQEHRGGILAVLDAVPRDPGLAVMLAGATGRSMAWMLEGAGGDARSLRGLIRVNLVTGAWLYAVRAWQQDESLDLSSTMAALDRALDRLATLDPVFSRDQPDPGGDLPAEGPGGSGDAFGAASDHRSDAAADAPFEEPTASGAALPDLVAAAPPYPPAPPASPPTAPFPPDPAA